MATKSEKSTDLHLQLTELNQLYETSLKLMKKLRNEDELLDSVLDEFARRFSEIPEARFDLDPEKCEDAAQREKLRALLRFAHQADLLKENAEMQASLRQQNKVLARMARKLKRANQELRQLNAHYLNMLGFVSHELRSPLISILGFAELLEEEFLGPLNVEQQNSIQIIICVARSLIEMIKNYLDLAKIENDEMKLNWQQVNIIQDLLEPIRIELAVQLEAKGMRIEAKESGPACQDLVIEGDVELLKVVLTNIFNNSIKYGRPNTTISYRLVDLEDRIYVSVTNEGPGVSKKNLSKVFDKFSQNLNTNPDLPRGTGLGLYNTRCIIEAHNGTIWADSEENKWFKICFTLPKTRTVGGGHTKKQPLQEQGAAVGNEENEQERPVGYA